MRLRARRAWRSGRSDGGSSAAKTSRPGAHGGTGLRRPSGDDSRSETAHATVSHHVLAAATPSANTTAAQPATPATASSSSSESSKLAPCETEYHIAQCVGKNASRRRSPPPALRRRTHCHRCGGAWNPSSLSGTPSSVQSHRHRRRLIERSHVDPHAAPPSSEISATAGNSG